MRKIIAITLIFAAILCLCSCGLLPESQISAPTEADEAEKGFVAYFIDVGQADSAPVICDGETMLIDGGNAADSSLIYSFLEKHGISHLDYVVASHAHEDHVGGLAGALNYATAGDAERQSEQDILNAGYNLSATVLKVAHHGSDTSTTYPFLREIMPEYAVISCGANNSYGHPDENVLSRLRDSDVALFRTDTQGTVTCRSDGQTVSFTVERKAIEETNLTKPAADEPYYIANINTHKFHRPSCSGLPAEKNRVIFDTRDLAINEGYNPCAICDP